MKMMRMRTELEGSESLDLNLMEMTFVKRVDWIGKLKMASEKLERLSNHHGNHG